MVEDHDVESLTRELSRLRIKLAETELKLANAQRRRVVNETTPAITVYTTGDRVKVLNKIARPAHYDGIWDETARERERQATVTHVVAAKPKTPTQVWIVTDNDTTTWRAPKNLARIEP
jgi:hypothetical protein